MPGPVPGGFGSALPTPVGVGPGPAVPTPVTPRGPGAAWPAAQSPAPASQPPLAQTVSRAAAGPTGEARHQRTDSGDSGAACGGGGSGCVPRTQLEGRGAGGEPWGGVARCNYVHPWRATLVFACARRSGRGRQL
jgi:hypothetical protein